MKRAAFVIIITMLCMACTQEPKRPRHRMLTQKEHTELNKKMFLRDSLLITRYCIAQGLDSLPTASGIWLTITKNGNGDTIRIGEKVRITYIISDMLSGEVYYRTDSAIGKRAIDKPYIIEAAKGQAISGIDDVITLLTDGSEATLVLQPDKAYGLIGDEDRINGRRLLVYRIRTEKIKS